MYQDFLDVIGLGAKSAAGRDMDDYDPKTGTLDRSGLLERATDFVRGGTGAVNEAAQKAHIKGLQKYADAITEISGKEPIVTANTTKSQLLNQARTARETEQIRKQEEATQRSFDTPQAREDRNRNTRLEERGLRNDLAAIQGQQANLQLERDKLSVVSQQEANRMAEETRRYDERRADSKKERMAAIIAGLANLGGAFTI